MLNLILTTDKVSVITSAVADIEAHASWVSVDTATGNTFTPGKTNTKITTATTTDIVPVPASGQVVNVKWMSLRNKHATLSNDVTVQFNASGTLYELIKVTLLAGEELVCHEGTWFHFDAFGGVYASGINIGGLPAASAQNDADEFVANQSGVTRKISGALMKAWVGDMLQNQSTAAQSPTAATLTYLTGSNIAVPVGKLRIGTRFQWRLDMTKTGAGTAARTFHIRCGTLGTTADAAIITITSALGTAVIDQAFATLDLTIRGPLSASCLARAAWRMDHQLAATGFMTVKTEVVPVTSGTFDATTANLIVGLSVTTGASEVITFEQLAVEAKNL